jgi:uncharacterized RDD family membrane protein YckC
MKTTLGKIISFILTGLFLLATLNVQAQNADDAAPTTPAVNEKAADETQAGQSEKEEVRKERRSRGPIIEFWRTATLKTNEEADVVIALFGPAKIHGKVQDAVVSVFGDTEIDGEVGGAAVSVFGNLDAKPGTKIHEDAICVFGDFTVGPGVKIRGNARAIGGVLDAAESADIQGEMQSLPLPFVIGMRDWVKHCVLLLRPLSLKVGWVWIIAGIMFMVYLGITVLFPRAVGACVGNLTQRPATTFFMGLLTKVLVPIIILLLVVIGVGVVVVPFIGIALLVGALFGKAAFAQFIGLRVGEQLKIGALATPLAAFLLGTVIIVLLYMVPVLGLIVFGIISVWGLGAAVMATFGGLRREMPPKPIAVSPASTGTISPVAGFTPSDTAQSLGVNLAPPPGESSSVPPVVPAEPGATSTAVPGALSPTAGPYLDDALRYPRASFWERIGAAFLDIILISIVGGIAGNVFGGPIMFFLLALAYFAGLWTWRGTTVGGIVVNLKVVRADGQPMNLAAALVRALAAAFSVIVFFLGFLWILWDKERQGWHDKIAGTAVVRLPRGVPLVVV